MTVRPLATKNVLFSNMISTSSLISDHKANGSIPRRCQRGLSHCPEQARRLQIPRSQLIIYCSLVTTNMKHAESTVLNLLSHLFPITSYNIHCQGRDRWLRSPLGNYSLPPILSKNLVGNAEMQGLTIPRAARGLIEAGSFRLILESSTIR